MNKEIYLLRHFEDEKHHDGRRNSRLLPVDSGALTAISIEINRKLASTQKDNVIFLTSPLDRSTETTGLVTSSLREINPAISYKVVCDARLSALTHGIYSETDSVDMLIEAERVAWRAFVEQTFDRGNIFYRHGDPLVGSDNVKYPNLIGRFNSYGENQLEFTLRTYSFWVETLRNMPQYEANGSLVVVSSHLAPLMRISELVSLSSEGLPPIRGKITPPGKMYIEEWNEISRIRDTQTMKAISQPGGGVFTDVDKLVDYLPALENELAILKAISTQAG